MRIVCPNCAAQYEVADDAIPAEGREVQCTNCAEIWHQNPVAAPMPLGTPQVEGTQTAPEAAPAQEPAGTPADDEAGVFQSRRDAQDTYAQDVETPQARVSFEQEVARAHETEPTTDVETDQPAQTNAGYDNLSARAREIIREEVAYSEGSILAEEETTSPAAAPAPSVEEQADAPASEAPAPAPAAPYDAGVNVAEAPAPVVADAPTEATGVSTEAQRASAQAERAQPDGTQPDTTQSDSDEEMIERIRQNIQGAMDQAEAGAVQPAEESAPSDTGVSAAAVAASAAAASAAAASAAVAAQPAPAEEAAVTKPRNLRDLLADDADSPSSVESAFKKYEDAEQGIAPTDQDVMAAPTSKAATESIAERSEDRFPDVEELEASLDDEAEQLNETMDIDIGQDESSATKETLDNSQFWTGFMVAATVLIIAVGLYGFGRVIGEAVPALAGPLGDYTNWVDGLRLSLQQLYTAGGEPGLGNFARNALSAITGG